METRPRHSYVRRSLAFAALATVGLWAAAGSAATEDGQPLQLDVLINGDKTGLPRVVLAASQRQYRDAPPSELVEVGIKVPGSGKPGRCRRPQRLLGDNSNTTNRRNRSHSISPTTSAWRAPSTPWRVCRRYRSARLGLGLDYTLFARRRRASNEPAGNLQRRLGVARCPHVQPLRNAVADRYRGHHHHPRHDDAAPETSFAYSHPDSLTTYRLGDSISGGLAWTRSIRFGGIQAQRNFAMRSDLVTAHCRRSPAARRCHRTLDVYMNNSKTYTQEVPPGPFQVNNLPLISGGEARLVLRDATGREVETTLPFLYVPAIAARGLDLFSRSRQGIRAFTTAPNRTTTSPRSSPP